MKKQKKEQILCFQDENSFSLKADNSHLRPYQQNK